MNVALSSREAVMYVVLFVVPGFIWYSVVSALTPRKTDSSEVSFLRYFTLSCVNAGIWCWLVYLLLSWKYFEIHPIRAAFTWAFIILVSPLLLGSLPLR